MSDAEHFRQVTESSSFVHALERNGLTRREIYKRGWLHNDGLKIWKDSWQLALPGIDIDGLHVHYESRRPGHIQVDIEVYPYEGSIDRHPDRKAELKPQLELKGRLISQLRELLVRNARSPEGFEVSTKRLGEASATRTLCAAQFLRRGPRVPDVDEDAEFLANVLDYATPVVDQCLSRHVHNPIETQVERR